jgi:SAM-dependent methyltransferase
VNISSQCPICLSNNTKDILYNDVFPYFTVPVTKEDKQTILEKYTSIQLASPLSVKACVNCFHCYLDPLPDQKIIDYLYSNYYSYPSPLKGQFQPERDDRFLQFFNENVSRICKERKLNRVLEVGCFDGYILFQLQKKGFEVTGCDPSEGAEIGKEYGVFIRREFFDAEEFLKQGFTFDIVISRHFIEHVTSPREWAKSLKKILNPNGLLIIETPNVSFYLNQGLLEIFSLQHLQGFSSASLNYTLMNEGLKTLIIEDTPNNLIVLAESGLNEEGNQKNNWLQLATNFSKKLEENKKLLQECIVGYISQNKTITMWGAGGFGLAALMLYGVPSEQITYIIDSDSKKWDLEYLNYSIPVISPQKARKNPPDVIIITSMYSKSIQKTIVEMGFKVSVLTIFPKVSLKDINTPVV